MNDRQRRKKATKVWLRDTGPINLQIYHLLNQVKFVLIALFVYLLFLAISVGVFTLQNARSHAFGQFYTGDKYNVFIPFEKNYKKVKLPFTKVKIKI